MRTIRARELKPGHVIIRGGGKTTAVKSIEPGESCKGVHVNTLRVNSYIKRNGKTVLNPERGRIISSDGCYDAFAFVTVQ